MPIYAYECRACGHQFDAMHKISEPAPTECPSCHKSGDIKKQLTAPGFQLKGNGWYQTDFKGNKPAPKPESKAEAAADAAPKAGGCGAGCGCSHTH